jgi:hypothetical protein
MNAFPDEEDSRPAGTPADETRAATAPGEWSDVARWDWVGGVLWPIRWVDVLGCDAGLTVVAGGGEGERMGSRSADGPPMLLEAPAVPPGVGAVLRPRLVKARAVDLCMDPEFRDVLPEPSAASRAALRTSLLAHGGCTSYILTWAAQPDTIVDGHTRYPLCREHDLWIWLGEIDLPDRAAVKDWIRQFQFARRDLGRLAASCLRGEAYLARKGRWGGCHRGAGSSAQPAHLKMAQVLGAEFQVDAATIRRDGQLALRVAEIAARCGPEARRALLCGDHRVSRPDVFRLGKMGIAEQQAALRYLREHKRLPPAETENRRVVLPRRVERMVPALLRQLSVGEAEALAQRLAAALAEARERGEADRPR